MPADPLCFVLMPFGRKRDPSGGSEIDFDRIYDAAIKPGIAAAGMQPIRADEERTGGIIHVSMFERLLLCEFAVADLTAANANVFYELGVRHALRPQTTLPIFARDQRVPFDVGFLRGLPYDLGEDNRFGESEASSLRGALTARLTELREEAQRHAVPDSPVFRLIDDLEPPSVEHLKTDTFRDRVRYSEARKDELARARNAGNLDGLQQIEGELGALDGVEAGVVIDLFLSYRALSAWGEMETLYERMPEALKRQVMLREQLAFALNRQGERGRAKQVLERIVADRGPSSETCGLLGRIHKDLWGEAVAEGTRAAAGHLDDAIAAYRRGFEADWRDAYPGINAVTLLDIRGTEADLEAKNDLLPVVRFSVKRRLAAQPDYWDYATMLELAVLGNEAEAAEHYLGKALASVREDWEPKTTANNLGLIAKARRQRGVEQGWLDEVIVELERRATGR